MKEDVFNGQNVLLYNRNKVSISGIKSVDSFDETFLCVTTNDGERLCIEGQGLTVKDVDLDNGNVQAEGMIISFYYDTAKAEKVNLLSALFKRQ